MRLFLRLVLFAVLGVAAVLLVNTLRLPNRRPTGALVGAGRGVVLILGLAHPVLRRPP